jgi:hypothetical protein
MGTVSITNEHRRKSVAWAWETPAIDSGTLRQAQPDLRHSAALQFRDRRPVGAIPTNEHIHVSRVSEHPVRGLLDKSDVVVIATIASTEPFVEFLETSPFTLPAPTPVRIECRHDSLTGLKSIATGIWGELHLG